MGGMKIITTLFLLLATVAVAATKELLAGGSPRCNLWPSGCVSSAGIFG